MREHATGILHCGAVTSPVIARQAPQGAWKGEILPYKEKKNGVKPIHQPSVINRNLEWTSDQGDFSPSGPVVFIKIGLFALLWTKCRL